MIRKITLITLLLMLALPAWAGKLKIEPDQRYLLLATSRTSTMKKELDQASAQGFRVVVGSPTSAKEMVVLLERSAKPPDTYKYELLATTRTSTMQKELKKIAGKGFRLIPSTMLAKKSFMGGDEIVLLMERPPKVSKKYTYKLLATTLTSTLQKEITESIASGFVLMGMVSRDEHMVIMEKEIQVKQ